MKYYLCKPADGPPRLENTQADAKAVDPKFVQHDVPDDKEGRRVYVNALLAKAHGAETLLDQATNPFVPDPVPTPKTEEVKKVVSEMAVPVSIVDVYNRTSVEEALWATDERGLQSLEAVIAMRREELAAKSEVAGRDTTIDPPKRRRKSA